MGKRSFTLNPNNCVLKTGKPDSACFFDWWSIHHFYWQGLFYLILHYLLKISNLKSALILTGVLTLLHIVEEYFGNTSRISFEGIVIDNLGPVINPKIDPKLRRPDNDYLQNSIGDVISGLIANLLVLGYWYHFNELPWFYLIFLVVIIAMLLSKSSMLYPKKEKFKNVLSDRMTIITAYFDVKRTRNIDYTQGRNLKSNSSNVLYREWMKGMLSYNGPMVIYCDKDNYEYIRNLRENYPETKIVKMELNELKAYKYFENNEINKKEYVAMVWKESKSADINKKLYTIWNSKVDLLKKTVDENPFNTKYFSWYDIGYMREPKPLPASWPNQKKLDILKDKILMLSVYYDACDGREITAGGYIGCNTENIHELHKLYYDELEKKHQEGKFDGTEGSEQNLLQKLKCDRRDLIHSITGKDNPEFFPNVEGKWFYMIPYFI